MRNTLLILIDFIVVVKRVLAMRHDGVRWNVGGEFRIFPFSDDNNFNYLPRMQEQ